MTTPPAVSIVLPVRNGEAYISAAIDSMLNQSFGGFEMLVINDGSTDGTLAILTEAAKRDARIRILKGDGKGLVHALNLGINEARGHMICRMDADDLSDTNRLERQVAFLEASPEVDLVFSQMRMMNAAGELTGKQTHALTSPEAVKQSLERGDCEVHHPTVLGRRQAFLEAGLYREAFARAEDLDLWLRMSEHGKIAGLDEILLTYRIHGGQVSREHTLRQRFSRDLTVLCARHRRTSGQDPMQGLENPVALDEDTMVLTAEGEPMPSDILALLKTYRALDAVLSDQPDRMPDTETLRWLLKDLRQKSIFPSARLRQKVYHHIVQAAFGCGEIGLGIKAALRALQNNPSRAIKQRFKPV